MENKRPCPLNMTPNVECMALITVWLEGKFVCVSMTVCLKTLSDFA